MTLYKITPKIDLGIVIGTYSTDACLNDTYSSLKERLESDIGSLLVRLHRFIKGELDDCEEISQGIYRRKIEPSDYTLNLDRDSLKTIKAKIRSQSSYGGAVLCHRGHRYRIQAIYVDKNQAASNTHKPNSVLTLPGKTGILYALAVEEGE